MNHLIALISLVSSLVFTNVALAHEGHEHAKQLDQATAVETAGVKMQELISEGEVSAKWAAQAPANAQLARINGMQNWVVTYIDASANERLEMVFSMTGDYVSVAVMPVSNTAAN